MSGPGLPVKLPDETYSCFFEDVMGRFNISVPSVEVTAGTSYTCDITDQVPSFDEVQVGMYTIIMYMSYLALACIHNKMILILHIFSCALQFCELTGRCAI